MKDGIVESYTSLDNSISIDVAIIGAGMSGALTAYYLRNSGFSLAVFDRRHVGMGSTAASTAFLQYEIDTPLTKLSSYVGPVNAVRCYKACRSAIYDIESICKKLKPSFDFHIRPSLHYASFKKDKNDLFTEYTLRRDHGFKVDWLESGDVEKMFRLDAPAAILSADGGEVDAYLLTHALFKAVRAKGHHIFSNTNITDITHHKHGVTLTTAAGLNIKAKKLVIACGYESQKCIPKQIAQVNSTYALVSESVQEDLLWHKNSLMWETATPYMYFRIVSKNRILLGGKDDFFHNARIRDARIKRKTEMLLHSFSQKMKQIPLKADFSWAGAFAVTKDGLPYIGAIPERPHTYFALGYGGNGITFSVIAAEIIRDLLLKKKNNKVHLFDFNR